MMGVSRWEMGGEARDTVEVIEGGQPSHGVCGRFAATPVTPPFQKKRPSTHLPVTKHYHRGGSRAGVRIKLARPARSRSEP